MPNNITMRVLALMLAAVSLLSPAVFAAEGDASREPEETAEAAGTDASVLLPDGSYTPDTFTFSGGTGRVTAECDEVIVKDGKAYAVITVSSANYTYFKANGRTCYTTHAGKTSTATIPVRLNATNTVYGLTTAMSTPHEVAYTVYIHIEGAVAGEDNTTKTAQKIPDLVFLSEDTNKASALFEVYRYEKGYAVINVIDVARYLVVPDGADVPGALDGDIMVVQQPVSNVYVSAPELSDTISSIGADGIAELLTLKGYEDGVQESSGIITAHGVIGFIDAVEKHLSYARTFMNTDVSISARLGGEGAVGPLSWDGKKTNGAILKEIPLLYKYEKGDTVYTILDPTGNITALAEGPTDPFEQMLTAGRIMERHRTSYPCGIRH